MSEPLISIIVLTWNGKDDTLECLKSLRGIDYPNHKTIVVDNGSTDGTVDALRAAFPRVEVLETGENLGFAEGNNVGIRRALADGAQAVLLLNNDTTVDPPFLSHLAKALYSSRNIGAANPTIYYHDDPEIVWSAGGQLDWRTGIAHQRGINERRGSQLMGRDLKSRPVPEIEDVDYGVGAALLMRREAIEAAGLLDPGFFIYYEETDWCCRARGVGFRTVYVPEASIWHKVSRTMDGRSAVQLYYFCRNRLMFLNKRGVGKARLLGLAAGEFGRMSAAMALRGEPKLSRAVTRAVIDFYLGRQGKARL